MVRALLQRDAAIRLSVSCTTRAPRPGEQDGREYRFISVADFEAHARRIRAAGMGRGAWNTATARTGRRHRPWRPARGLDVLLQIDWQRVRARSSSVFRARSGFLSCRPPSTNLKAA